MLLQIKTSKYARALEEEGVGIRILDFYIFEREAVIFFSWLCDYSDKFPKICFAVRAVGNALQPQISVINAASNLIESGLE